MKGPAVYAAALVAGIALARPAAAVVIEGTLNVSPERGVRLDLTGPALPIVGSRQTLEAPYPPVPVEVRNRQSFSVRADAPGLPPLPELPGAPSGLLTLGLQPVQSLPVGLPALPVSLPVVNDKGVRISLPEILPDLAAGELPSLPDLGLPELPAGGTGALPEIALPALPSLPAGSLPDLGSLPAPPNLPSLSLPAPSLGVAGL